jgi:RecB family exonuclease
MIHTMAEEYLQDIRKIYPPELQKVAGHAMMLKTKKAKPEAKVAVKEDWAPCDFDDSAAYFRGIIDVIYQEEDTLHIQDWKTGQVYDSHKSQLETYVALAAPHYPEVSRFAVRAIYIDQGMVSTPRTLEKEKLKPIRLMIDGRIKNAETDEVFPTKPGSSCRWCDFSKKNNGPCEY